MKTQTKKDIFIIIVLPLFGIGMILGAVIGDYLFPDHFDNDNFLQDLIGIGLVLAGGFGLPTLVSWLLLGNQDPLN